MSRIIKIGLATISAIVGGLAIYVAASDAKASPTLGGASSSERERTLLVNYASRVADVKIKNDKTEENINSSIVFSLSEGTSYGFIYTSQNQSGISESDNAVFVLWGHNYCEFTINTTYYDDETITKDSEVLTMVKFRHLSQIDIKLNKGNGSDRLLSLTSEVNGDTKGVFETIANEPSYIQYSWKPDNQGGFLTSSDSLSFYAVDPVRDKAVWVTDLVFHYTC